MNGRYFTDGTGKAILLYGAHTWENLQDVGDADPPVPFDYEEFLDTVQTKGHNFFRLWRWESARWGSWISSDMKYTPLPYLRTGPGNAQDGKPKFDLTQFNQDYFDRMRSRIIQAGQRGFYVSVQLFNGWSIDNKGGGVNNPWDAHPYNSTNNINGLDGDADNDDDGTDIHFLSNTAVVAYQEDYVTKVIDTVNDLDNVLYEISNESHYGSESWQYYWIDFIHDYEAGLDKQHPVGMSVVYPWPSNDRDLANQMLYDSPADWIAPAGELYNPTIATGSKVVMWDTDHLCGICGDAVAQWEGFLRGNNPIFMDVWDCSAWWYPGLCSNSDFPPIRDTLGYIGEYAVRMDLVHMAPSETIASTGFCLVETDAEYLAFQNDTGSFTINLTAASGTFNIEWCDIYDGSLTSGGTTTGGATRTLTPPWSGPAVAYLYK